MSDGGSAAYWQARGEVWNRHAEVMARPAQAMNQPLIDAADIRPGQQVLDLASGPGEPALTIAGMVGPDGHVTATDLVPEMLEGAGRRAADQGISNLSAEVADMQALPFEDGRFDRVTCRFGIMFPPDKAAALRECHRVLKPGGRAAFLVWGPLGHNTMFGIFHGAFRDVLGDAMTHDSDSQFSFAADGAIAAALADAGFDDVEERDVRFEPEIDVGKKFWLPQLDMNLEPLLAGRDDASALRAAIAARVEDGFAGTARDGVYRLSLHAKTGAGNRRP